LVNFVNACLILQPEFRGYCGKKSRLFFPKVNCPRILRNSV
jgi:hypothetical protein